MKYIVQVRKVQEYEILIEANNDYEAEVEAYKAITKDPFVYLVSSTWDNLKRFPYWYGKRYERIKHGNS